MRPSQEPQGALIVALLLAAGACLLLARACTVDAQDRPHLDAGRCLVAETDAREPDLTATAYVMLRRAARYHHDVDREARSYCAMYVARHPSARQLAIASTRPEDRSARGRQLRTALEALGSAERAESADPCRGQADAWGDRLEDARRARRAGWLEVDCGETRDAFWLRRVRVQRLARASQAPSR
jgi:hypothetical protein